MHPDNCDLTNDCYIDDLMSIAREVMYDTHGISPPPSFKIDAEDIEKIIQLRDIIKKYAFDKNITDENFGKYVRNCLEAMRNE